MKKKEKKKKKKKKKKKRKNKPRLKFFNTGQNIFYIEMKFVYL